MKNKVTQFDFNKDSTVALKPIYSWVKNKRTVTIICFVPLYDAYFIPSDHFSVANSSCSFTSYSRSLLKCLVDKTSGL